MIQFSVRERASRLTTVMIPVTALAATLIITSTALLAAGANPFVAFYNIFAVPLTTRFSVLEVLLSATPLIYTGLAATVAFRSGYYNIGIEGQMLAGAAAAAWIGRSVGGWPAPVAVTAVLLGGAALGAVWGLLPALLRILAGTDEVVTTLLLNPVAGLAAAGLLNGPWRDPVTQFPESERISAAAELPHLLDRSRLHLGLVIALVVAVGGWWVLTRTATGVAARAIGYSPQGAGFVGVPVRRILLGSALSSAAIAGLAGANEVSGVQYRLTEGLTGGNGYTGVVVATLGGLAVGGTVLAALLLGLVNVGSSSASRVLDFPSQISELITGVLLLVTVGTLLARRYRIRWVGGSRESGRRGSPRPQGRAAEGRS